MTGHTTEIGRIEPHEAEGTLVLTVIGNDGVRWACRTCDETVYERDGRWLHFDKSLNVVPANRPGEAGA